HGRAGLRRTSQGRGRSGVGGSWRRPGGPPGAGHLERRIGKGLRPLAPHRRPGTPLSVVVGWFIALRSRIQSSMTRTTSSRFVRWLALALAGSNFGCGNARSDDESDPGPKWNVEIGGEWMDPSSHRRILVTD